MKRKTTSNGIEVETFYYEVRLIGGKVRVVDPDEDIHSVAWFSINELTQITYAYEDLTLYFTNNNITRTTQSLDSDELIEVILMLLA